MVDSLWDRVSADEVGIVQRHLQQVPVRLGALAEDLGLKVFRSVLPPSVSGMIRPSEVVGEYEIRINKFDSPERQRFTLAHEISHFLLHKTDIRAGITDNIMYRSQLTSRKEAEANRLAADIVMPVDAVRSALRYHGGVVSEDIVSRLADDFKVSVPAMRIRLGG